MEIDDPRKWRISKSGFSIRTGWSDEKKLIAKYPGEMSPINNKQFEEWMDNAQGICDAHNSALSPAVIAESGQVCPVCKGNDYNAACAYPSEKMEGCLRDKRLAESVPQKPDDWQMGGDLEALALSKEKTASVPQDSVHLNVQEQKVLKSALLKSVDVMHQGKSVLQGEPTAWKYRNRKTGEVKYYANAIRDNHLRYEKDYELTPLYAAPPAQPSAGDVRRLLENAQEYLNNPDNSAWRQNTEIRGKLLASINALLAKLGERHAPD